MTNPTAELDGEAGWITIRNRAGSYRVDVSARAHHIVVDEPVAVGGTDAGATPYELLLTAIGSCTAMTVRMYANRKQWPLEEVIVRARHGRSHEVDCERCEIDAVGLDVIEREVELIGDLTDEQRTRLLGIADRCPVKQTLERGIRVRSPVPKA